MNAFYSILAVLLIPMVLGSALAYGSARDNADRQLMLMTGATSVVAVAMLAWALAPN